MNRQTEMTSSSDLLNFRIRIHKNYNTNPDFQNPKIVGYWSLDGSRIFYHDASQLRYYIPFKECSVYYDLNEGLSKVKRRAESFDDEKLRNILTWIQLNKAKIYAHPRDSQLLRPDFICYRGPLSKILKSPYDTANGWIICAAKFKETIYLCAFDTEEDKMWRSKQTAKDKKMTFWGKRFERYMLSDNPYHQSDTSIPVDESEEFCCVFEGRLNSHHLLFAAEMDGLCSTKKFEHPLPLDQLKFMELKTDKLNPTAKQDAMKKRFKSLNWWAQSYLVGVKDIVTGYRDDRDGIVRRLDNQTLADLEAESKNYWNSQVCLKVCSDFLSHVKHVVKNDYNQNIYKFERTPRDEVVKVTKHSPSSDYAFLPDWYISAITA